LFLLVKELKIWPLGQIYVVLLFDLYLINLTKRLWNDDNKAKKQNIFG